MICWGKISGANLAMINGGCCKGGDVAKNCRGNDVIKGRDDDVAICEGVMIGGEAKSCY